ncbi:MAG TPA: hypothetical protein VFV70_00820 [Hyphomonadaceae bacterium]|nr:hypothetical protein [Hyphomonadaceae bacterium]
MWPRNRTARCHDSSPLPNFPKGILVVQDDANPTSEVDQNVKIVDWRSVEAELASQAK